MAKSPTAISRRIQSCLREYLQNDYESAFIHLFPAIDATAKKRRNDFKVGARIKTFLEDEIAIITALSFGGVIQNCRFGEENLSIPEVLYKFGRTSAMHEGEIDERLQITNDPEFTLGDAVWKLPSFFIMAMAIAVITAPENIDEEIQGNFIIESFGEKLQLQNLWGRRDILVDIIKSNAPDDFKDRIV